MNKTKYILASAGTPSYMTVTAVEEKGKAEIRITDRISQWSESSADSVRAKVDEMTAKGITEANLYINSAGGNVFQANEIINELKKFSKLNITIGALAASAATRILAEFPKQAVAYANTQFMIHKPRGIFDGNEDSVASDLQMLKNVTADYKTAYAECSGKTEDEIEELWKGGDYWMNATQAQLFGLIGSVNTGIKETTSADIALLTASGAPTIPPTSEAEALEDTENNKGKEQNSNANKMDKDKLKSLLGLSADATDEQIEAAIKANKEKAETVTAALAQAEAQKETNIQAMVDAAITAKKITADQKDIYVGLAKADFEGTQKALNAMPEIEKVSGKIGGFGAHVETQPRKDWTLDDYLEKDPEAYEKLKAENPEAAAQLEKEYFGSRN